MHGRGRFKNRAHLSRFFLEKMVRAFGATWRDEVCKFGIQSKTFEKWVHGLNRAPKDSKELHEFAASFGVKQEEIYERNQI